MKLTDFLLARIAEDEAVAQAATAGPWRWISDYKQPGDEGSGLALTNADNAEVVGAYNYHCCSFRDDPMVEGNDQAHIARHDPARVLVECDAKRRIVEQAQQAWVTAVDPSEPEGNEWRLGRHWGLRDALQHLAVPYADHPDYREEWAV